jgi:hypothetical protein
MSSVEKDIEKRVANNGGENFVFIVSVSEQNFNHN